MDLKQQLAEVAGIHNLIACISVSGDDAIRMAEALQRSRALAGYLRERIEAEGREAQDEEQ